VAVKHLVDFSRINIFAAADYHVRFTVNDIIESICILVADVARVKPAAAKSLRSRFRVLKITFQDILAAQHNLAQLPVCDFPALLVNNLHLVADGQTARAGTTTLVGRIESRAAGCFRHPVTFNDEAMKRLLEAF
jgi:hypothetical protein